MSRRKERARREDVKALLAADQDFLRPLVQVVLQELLEAEMTEALDAEKGERTPTRLRFGEGRADGEATDTSTRLIRRGRGHGTSGR